MQIHSVLIAKLTSLLFVIYLTYQVIIKHMHPLSPELAFFIHLAKAKTVLTRRFDNRLSFVGVSFSDFVILHLLATSPEGKVRRTDLAEMIGLTQSGC